MGTTRFQAAVGVRNVVQGQCLDGERGKRAVSHELIEVVGGLGQIYPPAVI